MDSVLREIINVDLAFEMDTTTITDTITCCPRKLVIIQLQQIIIKGRK